MMRKDGFAWWAARFRQAMSMFDVVRIDHFRGFAACWEVPGGDDTAEKGSWVNAPGHELFDALRNALGELPFIAEDLGVITPDVTQLRDAFGFPGMRILQYAFGGDSNDFHLPHNYDRSCVVYTGTHDNDTVVGWYESHGGRSKKNAGRELKYCLDYLASTGKEINWDFIRGAFASVAEIAIVPMQDVLGLNNDSRMNLPASLSGNWNWQLREDAFINETRDRLRKLAEIYGRRR
jgi:4-alpha-glucanotransferase